MPDQELLAKDIPGFIKALELEKEHLLDAIREHRATKTPMGWSPADKALYQHLPEVIENPIRSELAG